MRYKHGFESIILHLRSVLESGGSVVVDALFIVAPIVCGHFMLVLVLFYCTIKKCPAIYNFKRDGLIIQLLQACPGCDCLLAV